MKTNHLGPGNEGDTQKPRVVVSRANSKLPIIIPFENEGLESEDPELEEARRLCKKTAPQEREIIRKITIKARRKMFGSPPAFVTAERAATPEPQPSGSTTPTPTIVTVFKVPGTPAPAAVLPQPAVGAANPPGPQIKPISPAATPPLQPAPPAPQAAPAAVPCPIVGGHPLHHPGCPVRGYSIAEARRLGLVKSR